jgi:hypothetical protein
VVTAGVSRGLTTIALVSNPQLKNRTDGSLTGVNNCIGVHNIRYFAVWVWLFPGTILVFCCYNSYLVLSEVGWTSVTTLVPWVTLVFHMANLTIGFLTSMISLATAGQCWYVWGCGATTYESIKKLKATSWTKLSCTNLNVVLFSPSVTQLECEHKAE